MILVVVQTIELKLELMMTYIFGTIPGTGNSNISNYNGDLYIQGNNGSGNWCKSNSHPIKWCC